MKNWKKCVLVTGAGLAMLAGTVIAAPNEEKDISRFTYYKVGVLLKSDGANFKGFESKDQELHMHGKIPNEYNVVGIQQYKYLQQYDLWLWKLIGFLEVAQEELP